MKYTLEKEQFFVTPRLARLVKKFSRGKSLDAGCGTGEYFPYFKSQTIYGIDITSKYIKKISKKNSKRKIILRKANIKKLPFPNQFFDFVFSSAVLEYMKNEKDFQKAINELKRVLKKNGILIVSAPHKNIFTGFFRKRILGKISSSKGITDPYFIMGNSIPTKKIKDLDFKTYGCLNWVTWKNLKNPLLASMIDNVFWFLPFFSGSLIGIYEKK